MMMSVAPLSEVKLIDGRYIVKTRCWGCVVVKGCDRWGGVGRCGKTPPPWPYVGAAVVVGVGVEFGLGGGEGGVRARGGVGVGTGDGVRIGWWACGCVRVGQGFF